MSCLSILKTKQYVGMCSIATPILEEWVQRTREGEKYKIHMQNNWINYFLGIANSGKLPNYQNIFVPVLLEIKAVSDFLPTILSHFIRNDNNST